MEVLVENLKSSLRQVPDFSNLIEAVSVMVIKLGDKTDSISFVSRATDIPCNEKNQKSNKAAMRTKQTKQKKMKKQQNNNKNNKNNNKKSNKLVLVLCFLGKYYHAFYCSYDIYK